MSTAKSFVPITGSITSLIAWLSVCLLAAGWGPRLDLEVCDWWVRIGCVGLAAAVGIEFSNRVRAVVKSEAKETAARREANRKMAATATAAAAEAQHDRALALADAVRRICQDHDRRDVASHKVPAERRTLFCEPVQVQCLEMDGTLRAAQQQGTVTAHVRNISPSGVRLIHQERIGGPRFLLPFVLSNGEAICLLFELTWQYRLAGGRYHSGGKLMDVVTPDRAGQAPHPNNPV